MDASTWNTIQTRNNLSEKLERLDGLLETLIEESAQMQDWARRKFDERLAIINQVVDAVILYDAAVQQYIKFHPTETNVDTLKQRLNIARLYVEHLGGNWQTVLWGKTSDYK